MKLEDFNSFLELITECGGYLFGGFVRDVLVPTFLNTHTSILIPTPLGDGNDVSLGEWETKNRDIDIFFKNPRLKDEFLKKMGDNFTLTTTRSEIPITSPVLLGLEKWNGAYNSFRISGDYKLSDTTSIRIDVVWGDVFPAYDVDVASLTCQYRAEGFWFTLMCKHAHYFVILDILKQISKKECHMTREYVAWMTKDKLANHSRFEKRVDRLFQKYMFRKWKVYITEDLTLKVIVGSTILIKMMYLNPEDIRLPKFRESVYDGIVEIQSTLHRVRNNISDVTKRKMDYDGMIRQMVLSSCSSSSK